MRKLKIFTLFIALVAVKCYAQNDGLKTGDILPNPVISITDRYKSNFLDNPVSLYDLKKDAVMLVVLLPDITTANSFAKIITTALDAYFAEGLSFRTFDQYSYSNPDLKVLLVTNNKPITAIDYQTKYGLDFDIVADENTDVAHFFGINSWGASNNAAFVYIVNKENKIVYARTDFKGEGEKLKEIQAGLFSEFNLQENISNENSYPILMQGDEAREFSFEYINPAITASGKYIMSEGKLSDYYGKKNVLIAFYPAPYSYSCAMEVNRFDTYAEEQLIQRVKYYSQSDLELLMVSVSNYYILSKWKNDMELDNVTLVSDAAGEISMKYNSYNIMGWNKRTVFLINKNGKVQYIDWDYNVDNDEDFGILKDQLTAQK